MNKILIKYDKVVNTLFWITLLLFSTHDLNIRLFSRIPWNSIELLCFTLFCVLTIISKKRRNLRLFVFLMVIYLIILISYLIGTIQQKEYIAELFFNMSSIIRTFGYLILFSQMDYEKIDKKLLYIAYINMFSLIITTINGLYSSVGRETNYLGIGLSAAIWIPIIMQESFQKNNKLIERVIYALSTIVFSVFAIFYGNRGSVIAILFFLIYCIFYYTNIRKKLIISIIMTITIIALYYNQEEIIKLVINAVNNLGITSRNLNLFLNNQITYSTHRFDEIWVNVLNSIKNNWITGYGLCYDRVINGNISIYAHNIILETWLSFGIITGSILLILYLVKGIKVCLDKNNNNIAKIVAPFFIPTTIVLMFNNSFCQFGFFWAFFGILLSIKKKVGEKKNENINDRTICSTWTSRSTTIN